MKCECGKNLVIRTIITYLGNSFDVFECECGYLAVENEGVEFVLDESNRKM